MIYIYMQKIQALILILLTLVLLLTISWVFHQTKNKNNTINKTTAVAE